MNVNFQAPLSGEAEERVAGAASPGESSPPCDTYHRPFIKSISIDKPNLSSVLGFIFSHPRVKRIL